MPTFKANSGGVQIDDGSYGATLLEIREEEATPNSPNDSNWLKWMFSVDNGTTAGVEMTATSSLRFGPKAKARLWVEALLGRKMEVDEEIDTTALVPRDCQVVIRRDESGFSRITDVLPPPKGKAGKAAAAGALL